MFFCVMLSSPIYIFLIGLALHCFCIHLWSHGSLCRLPQLRHFYKGTNNKKYHDKDHYYKDHHDWGLYNYGQRNWADMIKISLTNDFATKVIMTTFNPTRGSLP